MNSAQPIFDMRFAGTKDSALAAQIIPFLARVIGDGLPDTVTVTICPHCGLRPVPPDSVVLTSQQADDLLAFIYYVRFLFAKSYQKFYDFLKAVDSPLAGQCWDAFHEVNWNRMLDTLAANGHDIKNLKCYQHWSTRQRAA